MPHPPPPPAPAPGRSTRSRAWRLLALSLACPVLAAGASAPAHEAGAASVGPLPARIETAAAALAPPALRYRAALAHSLRPLVGPGRDGHARARVRLSRRGGWGEGGGWREEAGSAALVPPDRSPGTADRGQGGDRAAAASVAGAAGLEAAESASPSTPVGEEGPPRPAGPQAEAAGNPSVGVAAPAALPTPSPSPPPPPPHRPAFAACVGIMSRPVTPRRDVVRATWLPDVAALEAVGLYARFVVGRPTEKDGDAAAIEAALAAEGAAHGDLLRVPSPETYDSLLLKVLAFLRVATATVDAAFYIKTDDDVFARPDRLPAAAAQWAADGAGYVGCMFLGGDMIPYRGDVYYEPHGPLFAGRRYFGYMSGGFYALSAGAAATLGARPAADMRLMGCGDDCSVGLQMLALPVRVVEDWRVCTYGCQATSISAWREKEREREGVRWGARSPWISHLLPLLSPHSLFLQS